MSHDRGQVWKLLGAPADQLGSVNDPRTSEDYGVRWNEKWLYRGEDGETIERVVLWNRYDLVGVFRVALDGSGEAESLPEI
ncbi:MAG: hypothetical protein AAEJ52_13605 [Myxococcota bacterium]